MSLLTSSPAIPTLGDLLDRLGGIPAERVRFYPLPGTATEQDVINIAAREHRLCELVDGVLVEKCTGYTESFLAGQLLTQLNNFVNPRKLGFVTGEAGMTQLFPGLVRIPDVAYLSRQRVPGGRMPKEPIPSLAPDLAVEVLSESNTAREMDRKRGEYLSAGARLVWFVDPRSRSVLVNAADGQERVLKETDILDGGDVLPGLVIDLKTLLAEIS